MITVHLISDLDLGFNEFTDPVDETIPDVDLVIINGNIGNLKRSALYAESLCLKYPDVQFIWNLGELERYWRVTGKFTGETEENIRIRKSANPKWPKNLHWCHDENMHITLRTGQTIDVFCTYGFPEIVSYQGEWKDVYWYKHYVSHITYDVREYIEKPKDTSYVSHGSMPIWATQDWINKNHYRVWDILRKWERDINHFKILITHINPYNDDRFKNQNVRPYKIHLPNMLWATAKTPVSNVNFLGANLSSNPGRGLLARSKIVEVDTV
jgi:hypothetical protein